eukprot:COSAG02_NODE_52115_length_310_cov_0.336493_1_plen_50_part_00
MSYSLPAPFDVKLMNVTATVLFVGVAALRLAAVSLWFFQAGVCFFKNER